MFDTNNIWNRKITKRQYWLLVLLILVAFGLFLTGCTSKEQFNQKVSQSRDASYQKWKNRSQLPDQSQPQINGQLNLQDCLKLTLVNNKTLQNIVLERQVARGNELKSYSAMLPTVNLTGSYTRLDELSSFSGFTLGDLDNYSIGLSVTQPIFAGGSIVAKINSAKLFSLLTDQSVRSATQNVIYSAEHAYYDVLLNQHLYQISADAVRSAQAHLDDVKRKQQGGIASNFDVLRAEVELSNFKAELIQNKNAVNVSKVQLLEIMGVSQDSNVVLSDNLNYAPLKMSMEDAVDVAYHNHPDLFGRQFNVEYQKELLKIAQSRYWPIITASYDNKWANPDPHNSANIEWGHSWNAGTAITMPLFDGFARQGDVIQQKAKLKQSQISLTAAEESTLFELTKSLFSIENTDEFVQSQQLNLTRAREGHRLAEVGYTEGVNTQVEVIDAEASLTKAKSLYYQAIYSHIIAKLDLQKAMGVLSPKIQENLPADENDLAESKPVKYEKKSNFDDFIQTFNGDEPADSNRLVN